MTPHPKQLSDEEFAELLPDRSRASARVASDEEDSELLQMRAALASYRTETLHWAERHSATQPSLVPAARRSRIWAAVPQWSLATIAAVTIAAGVFHVATPNGDSGDAPAAVTEAVTATAAAAASPAEIAADNRLLTSIDAALSYHRESPVKALGLKGESARAHEADAAGDSE